MNTKKPMFWKKKMFGMQLSAIGGFLLKQLMNLEFKRRIICLVWQFCVRQWGGFMIRLLFSTFSHISFRIPSFL